MFSRNKQEVRTVVSNIWPANIGLRYPQKLKKFELETPALEYFEAFSVKVELSN